MTERAIGPGVSWLGEIGTTPDRLTRPTVGLRPTMPHTADGLRIDPSVSVPTASGASPAATAVADPDDEPLGLRSVACGFRVWPPMALHPELDRVERKFAHSERFDFAKTIAPARRSAATLAASRGGGIDRASDPAVEARPLVSMLSFTTTGMPCSGPRTDPLARSSSRS